MISLSTSLCAELMDLSREIHSDPELAYKEERSAARIVSLLRHHGHEVDLGVGGLSTAFIAHAGPAGASVAFLAEYDALAELGHGCGHNLIAISNVGAFLAAADAATDLKVGITVIGTPAEESGGGKVDLLRAGAFKNIVAALSTHPNPEPEWVVGAKSVGAIGKRVTFHGVASHAATAPERGRNALNGVIRVFIGIDGWRQHVRPDVRVHGIITDGGAAMNVVPERAEAAFCLRAADLETLDRLVEQFEQIVAGAALQTGTTFDITEALPLYAPVRPNQVLDNILGEVLDRQGIAPKRGTTVGGSTDLGNVSQVLPVDWLRFPVSSSRISGHSIEMRESSISELAHANALVAAEALAETALVVASDQAVLDALAVRG